MPTIDGQTLLKIPQGTKNGQRFRLREKGVLNQRTNQRGDQIVEVAIQAPDPRDERTRELLGELRKLHPEDPAIRNLARSNVMARSKSKAAYMISAVAEQIRDSSADAASLRARRPAEASRSDGNTRLYTEEDLERLEVILHLTRDLGVNLAGVEIILNMREKMGEMQSQIQEFVATLNRELVRPAHGRPG